jgi:hypothetical protein
MQNTSRCSEVDQRFPGLIAAIVSAHKAQAEQKLRTPKAGKPMASASRRRA